MGFTTHCFRDFKKFIGELTACAAGAETAVQYVKSYLDVSRSKDPWCELAAEYNIKVNDLDSNKVVSSISRLNLVSIYSGFDLYLFSYRSEHFTLTGKEWKKNKDDGPFDELGRNIEFKNVLKADDLNKDIVHLVDYYRYARNAIAHPSESNIEKVKDQYVRHKESLFKVKIRYGMTSAPNELDKLNFHDVKLFSRVLLDFLPTVEAELDPGNAKLKEMLPLSNWGRFKEERKRNAAIGYLRQKYAIQKDRAEEILAH